MVVESAEFPPLAVLPIVQTGMVVYVISGVGMATPSSVAVFVTRVGTFTDEVQGLSLFLIVPPADPKRTPDFAIQSVEVTIQGWETFKIH